jgi:hypothetical protein
LKTVFVVDWMVLEKKNWDKKDRLANRKFG